MKTIKELEWEIKAERKDFNVKESSVDDLVYINEQEIKLQTLKDVLEVIDEWSRVPCVDFSEKCHECVGELKKKITGEKE